jgi:hypothetical protein
MRKRQWQLLNISKIVLPQVKSLLYQEHELYKTVLLPSLCMLGFTILTLFCLWRMFHKTEMKLFTEVTAHANYGPGFIFG